VSGIGVLALIFCLAILLITFIGMTDATRVVTTSTTRVVMVGATWAQRFYFKGSFSWVLSGIVKSLAPWELSLSRLFLLLLLT